MQKRSGNVFLNMYSKLLEIDGKRKENQTRYNKMENTNVDKINMSISVDRKIAEAIKGVAKENNMNVSEIVQEAMIEFFNFYSFILIPIKRKTAEEIFDRIAAEEISDRIRRNNKK